MCWEFFAVKKCTRLRTRDQPFCTVWIYESLWVYILCWERIRRMSELSLYLFNVLCTLIIFFSTRDCEPFSKSKIHGFFKREIQKNPFVSAALISHVLQPLMVYMWTASSFTGVSQRQNNTISPASQPTNCFFYIWGSNWCHGLVAPYFSDRWSHIRKKKKDRRKGKSRRFCLGGRMYSIPYRTCYFAQDDYEE